VVPAIIRTGEDTDKMKLELAIIENLQREDLNPIDRAQAFQRLVSEFNLKHVEVAKKIGRSREYVSNSLRILALPQEVLDALGAGKITEGHTRPILMLVDRPEEQMTLFREIILKRLSVRESEQIARRIAYDKVRKKDTFIPPEILELEEQLTEKFGTRVKVEQKEQGGKVTIDYFSSEDLHKILDMLAASREQSTSITDDTAAPTEEVAAVGDSPVVESESKDDDDLYFIKNFSV
jgi:ParB family chromosome partitioning protein